MWADAESVKANAKSVKIQTVGTERASQSSVKMRTRQVERHLLCVLVLVVEQKIEKKCRWLSTNIT
jgi:hypothetical protein